MSYKAYPETVRLKTKAMLTLSLRNSLRRADKIITISDFSKREIVKYMGISEDRIVVAPCGVAHDKFKPGIDAAEIAAAKKRYGIAGNYFLYLGTLEPRKNIPRLIEAYASLKKEIPQAPGLVIAGRKGWMYNSIFERVKALDIEQYVTFTGYVADTDSPSLISGALAFLFPSLYEGFGMPPLEAMACGTPVLAANTASLPEVVGDCAVLVDPLSVEDIKNGLQRLTEDDALRKQLSKDGLSRAALFTWDRTARIVMGVYQDLLK